MGGKGERSLEGLPEKGDPPNLNWSFEKHIGVCWVKMKATRVSSAF